MPLQGAYPSAGSRATSSASARSRTAASCWRPAAATAACARGRARAAASRPSPACACTTPWAAQPRGMRMAAASQPPSVMAASPSWQAPISRLSGSVTLGSVCPSKQRLYQCPGSVSLPLCRGKCRLWGLSGSVTLEILCPGKDCLSWIFRFSQPENSFVLASAGSGFWSHSTTY